MYKFTSLCISVVALSAYAMEQNPEWSSWVKKASTIYIKSITPNYPGEIPIQNTTTIGDVKYRLHEREGIPLDHQRFCAVWQIPWTLGLIQDKSAAIQDDTLLVKDVMDNYNTKHFELTLMRPYNNSDTNYRRK